MYHNSSKWDRINRFFSVGEDFILQCVVERICRQFFLIGLGCFFCANPVSAQIWLGDEVSDVWSDPANWDGGVVPVSGATTELLFANDGVLRTFEGFGITGEPFDPTDPDSFRDYSSSFNDLGAFTLNTLTFESGLTVPLVLQGGDLVFSGMAPSLRMDAPFMPAVDDFVFDGADLSVLIENNLQLSVDTLFTGTGDGELLVWGDISGSGALEVDGGNYFFISNDSSYSGGTVIRSGGSLSVDRFQYEGGPLTISATGPSALGSGAIEVQGGDLTVKSPGDLTFARDLTITDGTAIFMTNLELSFLGGVTQTGGLVRLEKEGSSATRSLIISGDLDLDGGTFQAESGTFIETNGVIDVDGGAFLDLGNAGIIDINNTVVLNDGRVELNAINNAVLNGEVTINSGTFHVDAGRASTRGAFINGTLTVNNGGSFEIEDANAFFDGMTVVNGGDVSVDAFIFADFSGDFQVNSGDVTVDSRFLVNFLDGSVLGIDGGTFTTSSNPNRSGTLTMEAGSRFDIDGGVVNLDSGDTLLNGTLDIDGAEVTVSARRQVNFGGDGQVATIGATAAADVTIEAGNDIEFQGTLIAESGTLTVMGGPDRRDEVLFNGVAMIASDVTVVVEASLIEANGDFTVDGGDVTFDTSESFTLTDQLVVNAGSFLIDVEDSIFVEELASVQVTGGSLELRTPQIAGDPALGHDILIDPDAILDLDGGATTLRGAIVLFGGATVDDADLTIESTDFTVLQSAVTINNTGPQEVNLQSTRELHVFGDITVLDGQVELGSAVDIEFGIDSVAGFNNGLGVDESSVPASNTLRVDSGEVTLSAGAGFDFNFNDSADLDLNGGSLAVRANNVNFDGQVAIDSGMWVVEAAAEINQSSVWAIEGGSIDLQAGNRTQLNSTLNLDSSATFLVSEGDLLLDADAIINGQTGPEHGTITLVENLIVDNPTLLNIPNITIEAAADNQIQGEGLANSLTGIGTLRIDSGSATTRLDSSIMALSAAEIDIRSGTFLLDAEDRIGDATTVTLSGGNLRPDGNSDTLSTLTLAVTSTIDFSGGASTLDFVGTDISGWTSGATLYVDNWDGNFELGGGSSQLVFGGQGVSGVFSEIIFRNPAGLDPGEYQSVFLGDELVPFLIEVEPIPEPSTYLMGLGVVGILFWHGRSRLSKPKH